MATSDQSSYVIGVDIGGTKVAAGFVDHAGEITHVTRVPMVSDGDAAAGLNSVIEAIDALLAKAQQNHWAIRAIGICAPGPLDPNTGVVINPPNLPCWRNFPLAAENLNALSPPRKNRKRRQRRRPGGSFMGHGQRPRESFLHIDRHRYRHGFYPGWPHLQRAHRRR